MTKVVAFFVLAGVSLAADLQTGSPAPPLTLKQVFQAPAGADFSWRGLQGSALVLEFWATWCGGCREQIPHLNRLEEQFRSKAVRFLSITDEDADVVQRFLKDHPISGWIGLDANEQTYKRYGIIGRPITVLVDAAGVVRGIGNAADLTGATLDDLISSRTVRFSMDAGPTPTLQSLPEPLFEATIRPAGSVAATGFSPGAVSGKPGRRNEIWGVSLRRLLSDAYGTPEGRVEAPSWADKNCFDVALAAPDLTEARRVSLLRQLLDQTFELKVHQESRDAVVYVLRRIAGIEPKLRAASTEGSSGWGKPGDITAVSRGTAFIAAISEQALGSVVLDETGIAGRFDFELKWSAAEPPSLKDAIRTQLGLELVQAKRPLSYIVVDSAVAPRDW